MREPMTPVSYRALLGRNRNFRLVWLGGVVSQIGDWFNAVAVYALLLDLTHGSATAVAWMMVLQFLPMALVGPAAGVVVDRRDRRRIMIGSDLARGLLILGLLLVRREADLWLAYAVMAASVAARAFFEPARTATIPNITSKQELLAANALSSASWAAMLAIGAALGGLVTAAVGRDAAFVVNSASFFVSAILIGRTRIASTIGSDVAGPSKRVSGLGDLAEGLRYVAARGYVMGLLSIKAGWGIAGGAVLLLTIFGERIFPVAGDPAAGIGMLFGARGVGAGLGGLITRRLGHTPDALRRALAPSYLAYGACYVALAYAPNLWLAAIAVLLAHGAGAILWVASTVLLQLHLPDELRGRLFAVELAVVTSIAAAATYLTAYGLDRLAMPPRSMAILIGAMFIIPGAVWIRLAAIWSKSPPERESSDTDSDPENEQELRQRLG